MDTKFYIEINEFVTTTGHNAHTENEIECAFAKALKDIRQYSGLSLKALSKATQIPVATISAYENKTRVPSFTIAMKLSAFFGSNLEDFILYGLNEVNEYEDIFAKYEVLKSE